MWYHALRSSKEVFCTVKKVLCEISQYLQENTYAVSFIIKLHVAATLLKKTPTLVFFCEFTKLEWIPFLYNTSPWLLLLTRVSAEKVTYLIMQNMNTTQIKHCETQEHIAMSNVYIKWLFLRKIHRGEGNTPTAPSADPFLVYLRTCWKSCWKNIKLKKDKRKSDGELIFIVKCSLKLKVTLNSSIVFKF